VTGYYDEPDTVECENCGHDILSMHGLQGCELSNGDDVSACACRDRWTREDKRKLARDYGVRQTGIRS
jgi:hypothetical protein